MIKQMKILMGFILLIGVSSCCHYRLGSPGLECLPFRSIYVKGVENESFGPQTHNLVREQTIRWLELGGLRYKDCEAEAEAILHIVLTDYRKVETATLNSDTALASSFLVTLKARVSLEDNESGGYYFENREVSASMHSQSDASIQSLMYQDMPVLTERLAHNIRNLVVDRW